MFNNVAFSWFRYTCMYLFQATQVSRVISSNSLNPDCHAPAAMLGCLGNRSDGAGSTSPGGKTSKSHRLPGTITKPHETFDLVTIKTCGGSSIANPARAQTRNLTVGISMQMVMRALTRIQMSMIADSAETRRTLTHTDY